MLESGSYPAGALGRIREGLENWLVNDARLGRFGLDRRGEAPADEGHYVAIHEDWVERMKAAVADEMNQRAETAELSAP